ncbi:MAG: DNA-binding protein WhiA [Lachnospiraceae bacterium]|nr:DNA-binding protein WhiA [Lachnospiraceae bacterium]
MSFANEVKEELSEVLPNGRHCRIAELFAMDSFLPKEPDPDSLPGRKYFTLRKKTDIVYRCADADLKKACCRRAYVRGAFLSAGYINHPEKGYSLEFVCPAKESAELLTECLNGFSVEPKQTGRKGCIVLYLKEAEAIADTLNIMGASRTLLYLESLRVEKDVRNLLNRKVNCEAANIAKTVSASANQIGDIEKIEEKIGIENLPEPLRQMAKIRLQYPSASLSELGGYLDPPVGKSGVNHRLRKLSAIASEL